MDLDLDLDLDSTWTYLDLDLDCDNTGDTWDTVVTVSSGGQWCQLYQFNLSNLNSSQSVWCWQLILKYHFITYHLQHLKIFQLLKIFKESEAKIFKLQSHFQFYPGQSSTLFSFCFCFQTNLYGQSASFQLFPLCFDWTDVV